MLLLMRALKRNAQQNIRNYVADIQGVSQLLKQSDWAQIQDFK